MNRCQFIAFLALASLCAPLSASAANRYVLTNLGTLPGTDQSTQALAINSYGQVLVSNVALESGALLWMPTRPNSTTGTLINIAPQFRDIREATAINEYGQVVGNGWESGGQLWTPGTPNGTIGSWVSLRDPSGTDRLDAAYGINSSGQVAGTHTTSAGSRMVLWSPTVPNGTSGSSVELGDLPGSPENSGAAAINDYGQVAGSGNVVYPPSQAAIWTPTTANGSTGSMIAVYSTPSVGLGINAMGQVVGSRFPAFGGGFLWTPSTPNGSTGSAVELASLPRVPRTVPYSINSYGDVVGTAVLGAGRAILWTPDVANGNTGTLIDLNTVLAATDGVYWHLSEARGINDLGQIVGAGRFDSDGPGPMPPVTRGFLLTPVPEPSTLALALAAAVAVLSRRRGFRGA